MLWGSLLGYDGELELSGLFTEDECVGFKGALVGTVSYHIPTVLYG